MMGGINRTRVYVQAGAALLQNSYFFKDLKYCPTPALNCYACPLAVTACPIGTLQNLILKGFLPLAIVGFFVTIGAAVGRAACGWVCPFGFAQELLGKLSKRKLSVSNRLGWIRYVVLASFVLVAPYLLKSPLFCKLCPAGTLEAGIPLVLIDASIRALVGPLYFAKLGILAIVIVSAIFIKRPFCRFLCPLGAIYSPFNKISALKMNIDAKCTSCGTCKSVCPMDMEIHKEPDSGTCIRCMACTGCSAVGVKFLGKDLIKSGREGKQGFATKPD